jgi:hypothetical protein
MLVYEALAHHSFGWVDVISVSMAPPTNIVAICDQHYAFFYEPKAMTLDPKNSEICNFSP